MIQSLKIAFFSLFLTACMSHSPSFQIPEQVRFQGVIYQNVLQNRLDEMEQRLYLPIQNATQTPDNWQQGILFFLDRNRDQKLLAERLALRQRIFEKQPMTHAKLWIDNAQLRSEVVYPPTARFQNVQVEFSWGRNLPCGFGQIQFSDKQVITPTEFAKKSGNPTAYQAKLTALRTQFLQLPWLIECK